MVKNKKRRKNPMRWLYILLALCVLSLASLVLLFKIFPDPSFINHLLPDIKNKKVDVILDAGHGGYDQGSSYQDIYEKDIALQITTYVAKELRLRGVVVQCTRENDDVRWSNNEVDDLSARVKLVNESGAALFVSIHTNAAGTGTSAYGFEVWGRIKEEKVFDLAKSVLREMESLQLTQNRGMKDQDIAPLQILQESKVPAILIEAGFLANERDRSYLTSPAQQQLLAKKIANGIVISLNK